MGRKIAIVGTGAVGRYAGAHMIQAGEDVTYIDPWSEHVEHMRRHGLRVTHAMTEPEFTVPVRAAVRLMPLPLCQRQSATPPECQAPGAAARSSSASAAACG